MDRNIRLLGLGLGVRAFGISLYLPFLSLFLYNQLHVGYLEIGTVLAVVGLAQVPFSVIGGLVADRWPRRSVILAGLFAEGTATLGLAGAMTARSFPESIACALVGGAMANVAAAALAAYTADLTVGSERTVGFMWQRIGYNAGYAAGVAAGGGLIALLGFAGGAGVASLILFGGAAVLTVWLAPSPRDLAPPVEEGRPPRPSEVTRPEISLGTSLRALARDRPFLEITLALTLAAIVAFQWGVTFPLFVHDRLGIGYAALGFGLALNGVVVVVGQAPMTNRVLGWRHTTLAMFGLALYAAAFLGLGLAGWWQIAPLAAFVIAVVVLTLGENLSTIPVFVLPSNLAPPSEIGAYNGAFNAIAAVGAAVALVFGGWALGAIANPLLLWVVLVAPGIPAVLLLRHAAGMLRPDQNLA